MNDYDLRVNQAKACITQTIERKRLEVNTMTRQGLINNQFMSMGLDAKRSKAWCEYGYPDVVTFDMAYKAYRRSGIARSAIDKTIGRSWINNPVIRDEDDSDENTLWEDEVSRVINLNVYRQFKEADRRRMIGRYSGLLLYFNDYPTKERWQTKAVNVKLNRVLPIWENSLIPIYNGSRIQYWQVEVIGVNGSGTEVLQVHPSRIFILGDITEDGSSSLEAGFNNLIDIEKILGGGGESFAKNAARQLLVNFAKDIDLQNIATQFGIESKDLEEHFNAVVEDINTGNDTMMITQGANVEALTTTVPDPLNHFQVNLAVFASTFEIPQPILLGNNEGERASTENEKQWSLVIEGRRDGQLTYDLDRFVNLLMDVGAIPTKAVFFIEWQRLVSATATEKMEIADKMASVLQKTIGLFKEPVVSINELREAMDLSPIEEEEVLLDDFDATIPTE